MYPENPEGTQVIVGSVNMGYISDTARNRAHNLFRLKREPIPLDHGDALLSAQQYSIPNQTSNKQLHIQSEVQNNLFSRFHNAFHSFTASYYLI